MKALELLARSAREGQGFTPIQVSGGTTQGRIVAATQEPEKKNKTVVRESNRFGYAAKLNDWSDDEDGEELRERFQTQMGVKPQQVSKMRMSSVDDATSLGTCDRNAGSEDLNSVYKSYNFSEPNEDDTKDLLINKFKFDILQAVDTNNVVIIKGPTGCGKTTLVPLFILDDAQRQNIYCNILVTQPRRIAATSIAKRICAQRGWELGTLVGYQIALEKQIHKSDTRLTFVTAGVLLQKLVNKQLEEYTHIIVDEVHERENETDFILIILKKLIRMRNNRKRLILMSATMKTNKFADYLTRKGTDGRVIYPPVIDLPLQKNFELQYVYLDDLVPTQILQPGEIEFEAETPMIGKRMYNVAASLIQLFGRIERDNPLDGAVLVFLPGIVEIEKMHRTLRNHDLKNEWFIRTLHSSISFKEQMEVFQKPPSGKMKVILATNIAESSITVPDVKYVVDFCLTKRQVQDKDTFYSSLHLCWESKSQAEQRAGRAGRTMTGRVYRLVTKEFYNMELDEDSPPEIVRCPLDRLVLKAKQLSMGSPANVLGRAMDPPDLTNIERTILNLKELGALTLYPKGHHEYDEQDGDLTFTGQVMAELPLDTQLSKLVLVGHLFSVLRECVQMACCMTGKNIFASPINKKMETYNSKMGWEGGSKSDPLTALTLYENWKDRKIKGLFKRSGGESQRQWADRNFVHLETLLEVERLEKEILDRLQRLEITDTRIDQIKNNERVVPLILKVCLAGACYPNFFLHNQIDEEEAVKTLGKRDPCRTVYFKNFPQNQPGPLYRDVVKNLVKDCGSGIKVQFDGSSKIYVEFESSMIPHEETDMNLENDVPVPGKVMKAVYRAVKMRNLDIPMVIPLLDASKARERAHQIFGDELYPSTFCRQSKKNADGTKKEYRPLTRMPGLNQTFVSVFVTYVIDPSNFYVILESRSVGWIQKTINDMAGSEDVMVDLDPKEFIPGTLCLGRYAEPGSAPQWYRAKIAVVTQHGVKVHFIDYGNYEQLNRCHLKGYGPLLLEQKIHEEPPFALRCRLAEIGPFSDSGSAAAQWNRVAIDNMKKMCNYQMCDAKIYSVVNDTMAVILYPHLRRPEGFKLPLEESFNYMLVAAGLAQFTEEPFMSKDNHERREGLSKSDDFAIGPNDDDFQAKLDSIQFESHTRKDRTKSHKLFGPLSPLEMTAYPITRKCQGKSVSIDWNSINSVLINENPVDTTTRLIVAGTVSQSQHNPSLTLRNTTLMPSIRGLSGILALLFSPKSELRIDPQRNHFTGALCGLGCYDTGLSYDQENDVELTFDCNFTNADIETVNKLRFWMDRVLCRDPSFDDHSSSGPGVFEVQTNCVKYLLELFSKDKPPLCPTYFANKYEWGQLPLEYVLVPTNDETKVYKLICGVDLKNPTPEEQVEKMKTHLAKINLYITGSERMKQEVTCMLCQQSFDNVRSLDFHVKTRVHRMRVDHFFGRPFEKADMIEGDDLQQRYLRSYVQ